MPTFPYCTTAGEHFQTSAWPRFLQVYTNTSCAAIRGAPRGYACEMRDRRSIRVFQEPPTVALAGLLILVHFGEDGAYHGGGLAGCWKTLFMIPEGTIT